MNSSRPHQARDGQPVPTAEPSAARGPEMGAGGVEANDAHTWRQAALDMFESHSFVGNPGTERWCTRCTLMLPPDWKDVAKAVPPQCGDPRIRFAPAFYTYVDGHPVNGIRLASAADSSSEGATGLARRPSSGAQASGSGVGTTPGHAAAMARTSAAK